MSEAKQCDRCSGFYMREPDITLFSEPDKKQLSGRLRFIASYGRKHDLCVSCLKEAADALEES